MSTLLAQSRRGDDRLEGELKLLRGLVARMSSLFDRMKIRSKAYLEIQGF